MAMEKQFDQPILLPVSAPAPVATANAWAAYLNETLYPGLLQPPGSLPATVANAVLEQIIAPDASLTSPGPNFGPNLGPNVRRWAECVLLPNQVDPPSPINNLGSGMQANDLHADESFVQRVLDAVRSVHTPSALVMLDAHCSTLVNIGQTCRRFQELNSKASFGYLQEAEQIELNALAAEMPKQLSDFVELSHSAITAHRFVANLLVMRVRDWTAEQRRFANRSQTREKRRQKGLTVKPPPELRRELDTLAAQFAQFGKSLVTCLNELQFHHGGLPEILANAQQIAERQQFLDAVQNQLRNIVQLVAEHTLVIVHQPPQILGRQNRFAFKVFWLAGPIVGQFGVQLPVLLKARIVPGLAQTDEPDLAAPAAGQKAGHLIGTTQQFLGPHNAADGGQQTGHHSAWEAKYWSLRYEYDITQKAKAKKSGKRGASWTTEFFDQDDDDSANGDPARAKAKSGGQEPRVTERLHFIVVESDPIDQLAGLKLLAVSHPLVPIEFRFQECAAMCTIIWCCAFGRQEEVAWSALRDEICAVFEAKTTLYNRSYRHTQMVPGRGIPSDQLENIRRRYLNGTEAWYYNPMVKFRDLLSQNARGADFSLWSYLYSALKLLLEPLTTRLWTSGVIYGFVSEDQARDLLSEHVGRRAPSRNAMLVRFSENQLGAISVMRYTAGADCGFVEALAAWNQEKLYRTSLFDRLLKKAKELELVLLGQSAALAAERSASAPRAPELRNTAETLAALDPNNQDTGSRLSAGNPFLYRAYVTAKTTQQLIREGEADCNFFASNQ